MTIPRKAWDDFTKKLAAVNEAAAQLMRDWIKVNGTGDIMAAVLYAQSLVSVYGEAAASLACEMYDAAAIFYGYVTAPAIPAPTPAEQAIEAAIRAALETAPSTVPAVVYREVKQAGADTMLQNAQRDGAQWAWVPNGDTCAFCIALASRGWQRQSKKASRAHAEHIHNNCDCMYAIRFSERDGIAGYDPQRYLDMYNGASDSYKPQEKINALRREEYAKNKERINEQKREAYAERQARKKLI